MLFLFMVKFTLGAIVDERRSESPECVCIRKETSCEHLNNIDEDRLKIYRLRSPIKKKRKEALSKFEDELWELTKIGPIHSAKNETNLSR